MMIRMCKLSLLPMMFVLATATMACSSDPPSEGGNNNNDGFNNSINNDDNSFFTDDFGSDNNGTNNNSDDGMDMGMEDQGDDTPDVIIIEDEERDTGPDNRECRPELGGNNEPLKCFFYAHTNEGLYKVDPFTITIERQTDVPDLFDIDTHPDGTLYGLNAESLYRFDGDSRWLRVADVPAIEEATGLAIDRDGIAYVTAGPELWTVDLESGERNRVGEIGDFFSSGDCVINKDNSLFMSSKAFDQPDTLVVIDDQGNGSVFGGLGHGNIGFGRVYGLTAGWGLMFGMTSQGELLQLDVSTGSATLLHTFEDMRWYGAASTPGR